MYRAVEEEEKEERERCNGVGDAIFEQFTIPGPVLCQSEGSCGNKRVNLVKFEILKLVMMQGM